jgi:two-component system phosphate regulon sensor histidine kinase PhoR
VHRRQSSTLHLPIWTSVVLLTINVTLLVIWIVLWVWEERAGALAIGILAFALSLAGIGFYLFLTIKEIRLNRRQANFVDSVTHELKTPIASLQLYLETLQMRKLDETQKTEFYAIMESELQRLDRLINQLLEVGRLDAVGQDTDPEEVELQALLLRCATSACAHHKVELGDVFTFDIEPAVINSRKILLEMIFGNLLDNAVKYAADPPRVNVDVRVHRGRVTTRVVDNGTGVPAEVRSKIFKLFYRGGDELHRTKKGTGLGLYIVRTLVHLLKGRVTVRGRSALPGCVFEVELPGNVGKQGSQTAAGVEQFDGIADTDSSAKTVRSLT